MRPGLVKNARVGLAVVEAVAAVTVGAAGVIAGIVAVVVVADVVTTAGADATVINGLILKKRAAWSIVARFHL